MVNGSPEDIDGPRAVSLRGWVARAVFVLPFALLPLGNAVSPVDVSSAFGADVMAAAETGGPGEPQDHVAEACAMFRSALLQFDADGAGRAPRRLGEAVEAARRGGDRDLAVALQQIRFYVDAVVAPGPPDRDAQAAFGRGYAHVDAVCRPSAERAVTPP